VLGQFARLWGAFLSFLVALRLEVLQHAVGLCGGAGHASPCEQGIAQDKYQDSPRERQLCLRTQLSFRTVERK
jgi:hypothetical protein